MAKLLIEVECSAKTCGTCDLRNFDEEWRGGSRAEVIYCLAFCKKQSDGMFYYRVTGGRRHSACLAAERADKEKANGSR